MMRRLTCFLPLAGLLAALAVLPARAQREGDGPPAQDPFGRPAPTLRPRPAARYRTHQVQNNVLTVQATDGSTLRVRPWAAGVVKVEYFAPGRAPRPDSSVSVVQPPDPLGERSRPPQALANRLEWRPLFNGASVPPLTVVIHKNPLRFSLIEDDDTLISQAASGTVRPAPSSPVGEAGAVRPPTDGFAHFRLRPGERLYGTGARALPLDRRGYRLELYNQAHYAYQNGEQNLNLTLPTVLSSRGYLLFFDHHTAGYLDLGKADAGTLEYGGEGLTSVCYYVVTGRNPAEIIDRYTRLTGRQPLPPRWALGLIQSRFGYKTQAEMRAVAARMRRENFPLDALVLDLYWFGGTTRQGDLAWDKFNFPRPAQLMRGLDSAGVKTILISEPYVMRTSRNDSAVRTQGLVGTTAAGRPYTVASFWAGPASILDVFRPRARQWLWGYYRQHHDAGAAGWWSDLGEPENHPEDMRHLWGPTRQVHNAFGLAWAGIFAENYARAYPQERLFNLGRSGWAGMQRNSVFPWSGDINRSWSGFQAQVPIMLGAGAGGVGYMHSDAGGFCVGGVDAELYARWLQMAALCPILRPHGEGVPPEPYWYPEPYKSSVRAAAHLRYELLPYLYTLAAENTLTGAPLARTADFDAENWLPQRFGQALSAASPGHRPAEAGLAGGPAEPTAAEVPSRTRPTSQRPKTNAPKPALGDQYLLGPNLLVAPVLQPGQRRRNVALPATPGGWVDFYSNQTLPGGQTAGVLAPLARTPLLVRAGAIVPTTPYVRSTAQFRPDTLVLRYYPDPQASASEFTMYEDDGRSAQALARGEFGLVTLRGFCSPAQTDLLLSLAGTYPGQPPFRVVRVVVGRVAAAPARVLLDGQAAPPEALRYDPARRELTVQFLTNRGTALSLPGLQLLTQPAPQLDPETVTLEVPDNREFAAANGTTLRFTRYAAAAPGEQPAQLVVRDGRGQAVRALATTPQLGAQNVKWDGRDAQGRLVAPGVYHAELLGQHQRLVVQ